MEIIIKINSNEPDYPVDLSMARLEDFINLVKVLITPEDEEAGRYPASITDKDLETANPLTRITATFRDDGIKQKRLL